MNISFTKAQATGNDFVIIYNNDNPNLHITSDVIKTLCNRNFGVGADGLLFITNHNDCDFLLDYYNNDGTWETLCVNGIRCASLFMHKRGLIQPIATIMCGDGVHQIHIKNDIVSVKMKKPEYKTSDVCVFNYVGKHVDSGAQHFTILVDNVSKIDVKNDGHKIRFDKTFSPGGINVNFYSIHKEGIHVRTYEKGVESEMLSCGSGSIACVYDAYQKSLVKSNVSVTVLGGNLNISINNSWDDVWLSGESALVFSTIIDYGVINE